MRKRTCLARLASTRYLSRLLLVVPPRGVGIALVWVRARGGHSEEQRVDGAVMVMVEVEVRYAPSGDVKEITL